MTASGDGIFLLEEVRRNLVPPPQDGDGICRRCRTWNDRDDPNFCSNCAEIQAVLGVDALPLSVISLYRKPSMLRDWLTFYKDPNARSQEVVPDLPELRPREHISALLEGFLEHNRTRLVATYREIDAVVVVPSTHRPSPHPLESLMQRADLGPVLPLLERGPEELGFRKPARRGYLPTPSCRTGMRVLLVDDVYTTGARINSARVALDRGGCAVQGALILARRVNTSFSQTAATLWDRQSALDFDWVNSPYVVEGGSNGLGKN